MGRRHHRLLLWCAATDSTFRRHERVEHALLVGKCIHCNRKVVVDVDPDEASHATWEHIRPRTHGGANTRFNLAVACGGCNASKGYRLDSRRWNDPTLRAVVARLAERRRGRLRAPLSGLRLPPLSGEEAEIWSGDTAP
jgi:5-methylcytosine-specific restriction endonuclease McrA